MVELIAVQIGTVLNGEIVDTSPGFRLRFQPVGLPGRRVEPTSGREGLSYPRSALGGFVKHPG